MRAPASSRRTSPEGYQSGPFDAPTAAEMRARHPILRYRLGVRNPRAIALATLFGVSSLWATVTAAPAGGDPLGEITTAATGGVTPGFTADAFPRGIATGPDGNLWFVESGPHPGAVARVTLDGAVTEFALPTAAIDSINAITAGPDGAMWFTGFNTPGGVFRVTTGGDVTLQVEGGVTPGFASGNVQDIAAGPDGALWVTRPFQNPADELVRITTGGVVTSFGGPEGLPADASLRFLTVGPDGNLYITDSGQGLGEPPVEARVWRFVVASSTFELVATAGTTPGFTAGNAGRDITAGPDGNLWFLFTGTTAGIARLTTGGEVTEFSNGVAPDAFLQSVTVGCDGALWFTQGTEDASQATIWRAQTSGELTPYDGGLAGTSPDGLAAGPDGNLWVTNFARPGSILTVGAGCPEPAEEIVIVTPTLTG
jgi:virginiamycin B lyase